MVELCTIVCNGRTYTVLEIKVLVLVILLVVVATSRNYFDIVAIHYRIYTHFWMEEREIVISPLDVNAGYIEAYVQNIF